MFGPRALQRGTVQQGGTQLGSSSDTRIPRRNPKIEEAPLQSELMLFDPATARFFVMNATMAFLWRHCDGERSFPQIVDRLALEFSDVDPVTAEGELRKSLDELVSLGLLVPG